MAKVGFNAKGLGWAGLLGVAAVSAAVAVPQAAKADVTLFEGKDKVPSVIAYLRVDAGLRFSTNVDLPQYNGGRAGATTTLMQSGGNDWGTSMFGVKGTTHLSPNLDGFYLVESGFDATKGTFNSGTNSIFNRRGYAGLSNKDYGKIFVGKDLFIDNDIYDFDPMLQENISTATLVYGRNWGGASNMVEYRSPNWNGLQIGAQATFGNGDMSNTGNKSLSTKLSNAYGVSVRYDYKNLSLFGIYDELRDTNGHFTNLYSSSKEGIVGATFNMKPVKLFGGYENLDAPQASKEKGGTPIANPGATFAPYAPLYATSAFMTWVGAELQATPELVLRGAWFYTSVNKAAGHANLATVGAEYYLSDNVFLYLTVGEVINSGNASFSTDIGAPPPARGKDQFAGYNGISIKF